MSLQLKRVIPLKEDENKPAYFHNSTQGQWEVENKLGKLFIVAWRRPKKTQHTWMVSSQSHEDSFEGKKLDLKVENWLSKNKLNQMEFETRKEALECLESYLESDGLL